MYSNTMHCWQFPEGITYFTLCINVDSFLMVLCICVTVPCGHCTSQCNALLHRSSLRALCIPIQCIGVFGVFWGHILRALLHFNKLYSLHCIVASAP